MENSQTLADRIASLWNLPLELLEQVKAIFAKLTGSDQEKFVSDLELVHEAFEKQYVLDEEYLAQQEKLLGQFEHSFQRLEKKEKEVQDKEVDTSAMQSILSQIES